MYKIIDNKIDEGDYRCFEVRSWINILGKEYRIYSKLTKLIKSVINKYNEISDYIIDIKINKSKIHYSFISLNIFFETKSNQSINIVEEIMNVLKNNYSFSLNKM